MQKFKQKPLPLISIDSQLKYVIGKQALEMIQSLSGKIAVISVVGLYRTGKSYLLNRMLLNRNTGFGVGSTIQACTKGIWIWGKPLVQKINDEVVNVLIIDSEGLGSLSEDTNHDTKIFALTLLFSSLFIYNSVGSIDENTLAGLGLIVNLSKHLKVKCNSEEITNTDEFPHLFWVVRDFSLQLVDKQGKPITQNEYLQNSLNVQPGSADSDGRNEVRKAITKYFKDRDCVTLVRPSTNQQHLQQLDQMDLDLLKPEFVEQVLNFRKQVMSVLVPKTLYGKPLTGITFCEMLYSFTDSINTGGIPTIQTTWKYVCQQQSLRAFEKCLQHFDFQIHQHIKRKIPMPKTDFIKQTSEIKSQTQKLFTKLVGQNSETQQYMSELNQRMDSKIELLKSDNRIENVKAAQQFVSSQFESIDKKIRNQEYKKIGQLIKEIQLFQEYYKKKCPYQQTQSQAAISEFLFRKLCEGSLSISKLMSQQESQAVKAKGKQIEIRYQQQIEQVKQKMTKEKNQLMNKMALVEKIKQKLENKVEGLTQEIEKHQQNLDSVTKQKQTMENYQKRESNKSVSELKSIISKLEIELEDCKIQKNQRLSSQDRQILLLKNKIEYYGKNNQQLHIKLQQIEATLKQTRLDYEKTIKQLENKYETSKNALNCKIRNLDSLLEERINELAMSEAQKSVYQSKVQDLQNRNRVIKDNSEHNLRQMKEQLAAQKQSQIQKIYKQMSNSSSQWTTKIRRLQNQNIQKESINKQLKLELEKELALLNQKIEFLETQSNEKNDTINKLNSEYLQLMLIVESKDDEISQLHGDLKAADHEANQGSIAIQNQMLLLRQNLASKESDVAELNEQIETLRQKINSLQLANLTLKQQQSKTNEQLKLANNLRKQSFLQQQIQFRQQMKKLTGQFEIQKQQQKERTDEMLKNNERTLIQLKNFYEMEKERNEKKLFQETQKLSVMENQTLVALRDQYNMLEKTSEEEIEKLTEFLRETKAKLRQTEQTLQKTIQKTQTTYDQELMERSGIIQQLKKKEVISKDEYKKLEKQFEDERASFVKKVEAITFDMSRKQKQILQLTSKKQNQEQQLFKKQQLITELKREYEEQLRVSEERIDELKSKLQLLKDEHIELKIQSEKQLALSRQKNQFLSAKVTELIRQRQLLSSKNLMQKPQLDKNDLYKEQYQKAEQQIISLESKLEKARKATRQSQSNLTKQLSNVQKQKLALQEKLVTAEDKIKYSNLVLNAKVAEYQKEIDQLKDKLSMDKSSLSLEYDRLKQDNIKKGNQITDLQSQIQREKSLLEQKIRFIENQKDQLRKQLQESRKKLEFMMNQLQRGRKPDEDEDRKQLQNQKKMNSQLQILKQSLKRKTEEAEENQFKYKTELKQLKDKNSQLQDRLLKNEKQHKMNQLLVEQNDKLKKERDQMFLSHKSEVSRQSEQNRKKLAELEKKYKNSEKKNAEQTFIYEKERAKWNMEKDSINDKVIELQERLKTKEHGSLLDKKSSDKYKSFTANNNQMMKSTPYFFDKKKEEK